MYNVNFKLFFAMIHHSKCGFKLKLLTKSIGYLFIINVFSSGSRKKNR